MLSLPVDLLAHVVDLAGPSSELEFQFVARRQEEDDIIRQAIWNLRLTNKTLCQAVSHALIPMLRIRLSEPFLSRADEIISRTHIAAGIKGVKLILDYCPDNLVNDLTGFTSFKSSHLS